jgi:signal transduction histidine kinase
VEPDRKPEQSPEQATALAAMDELFGVLGHDLRNACAPLALLAEQLELMTKTTPIDPKQLASRTAILTRSLEKLMGTIDRVSDVAQLRTDRLVLQRSAVDLGQLVDAACDALAREAAAGGGELRRSIEPGVVGRWDRARIAQVATSLLANAIRYGGGGPIDVTVVADGNHARLRVRDHGPGIPAADRAHVFDRFDHPSARRRDRLGLGLWISRALCRAMDGDVTLESIEPGASFCVRLPRD